jgi:hypothetical protein
MLTRISVENNFDNPVLPAPEEFEQSNKRIEEINLAPRESYLADSVLREAAYRVFTNNGILTPNHRFTIENALSQSDLARFIPETIVTVIREAIEPETSISDLVFQSLKINQGLSINIGTVGSISADVVAEGTEGKTRTLQMGDGEMVVVHVKKHGINIAVTEEVIKYSQWDVLGLWLRAAGRAMARHKEKQAIGQLNTYGTVLFDNQSPSSAVFKSLTGRNIAGALNGSFTSNDLMKMYGHARMMEFNPDTLIIHPLAWAMWATDPELREIVVSGNRVTSTADMPTSGRGARGWADPFSGRGLRTKTTGNTTPTGLFGKIGIDPYTTSFSSLGSSWYIAPKYLPTPLRVIVSPWVPFSSDGGADGTAADGYPTSHAYMVDSNETGVFVYSTDYNGVYLEEWDEPARAIHNLAIRERYGVQILNQGKAISMAKYCVIAKNYVFENVNQIALAELPVSGSGLAN